MTAAGRESSSTKAREPFPDLEKTMALSPTDTSAYHFAPTAELRRKLWIIVLLETVVSLLIYYNYSTLNNINEFAAAAVLGVCNAMLAQSIHQASKIKPSMSRLSMFMVWGAFNGYATAVWIEFLLIKLDTPLHRILIDQVFGTPFFQLAYSVLCSVWDHNEFSFSLRGFLRTLKFSYCFWPFFAIALFYYIPTPLIFPANCLASMAWNVCLSLLT